MPLSPLDDGALITTTSHLYRLSSKGVEPFSNGGRFLPSSNLAYSMQMLPGGEIAVGTRKGGLVLLNRDGAVDRILSTANGLADDWVSEIHVDPQGGVWLAQNNGITRFNPGLSVFGKSERLEGDVQTRGEKRRRVVRRYNGGFVPFKDSIRISRRNSSVSTDRQHRVRL